MYLYVGGRRRNMCKSRKYFRTPHRRSGGHLGGREGVHEDSTGGRSAGQNLPSSFPTQAPMSSSPPFTSVGVCVGGGGTFLPPPWCSALLMPLGACLFGQQGLSPGYGRLC